MTHQPMAFGRAKLETDAHILAARRAWMALEGWQLVKTFLTTDLLGAFHTVYRREDEWRCTCADFQYKQRRRGSACKHILDAGGKGTGKAPDFPDRPIPAVRYDPGLNDDLTELLQASTNTTVFWVPECWDWILDGEMPTPSPKGPAPSPDDPRHFRGDFRKTIIRVEGFEIEAQLRSGPTTYWIEWLLKQNGKVLFQGTADGNVGDKDFGVPEALELPLPDGGTLKMPVKRYATEREKRRRGKR